MKKQAIIIDVDDTIADTQTHMLKWMNARSRRQYTWQELDRSFREGEQPEYERYIREILSDPKHMEGIEPYKDALTAIQRLHEAGFELHIVSSRQDPLLELTEDWLREHHFIDYIERVHPRPAGIKGHLFKRGVAERINALAAFDDTYDVGIELSSAGTLVYLIDKPWNSAEPLGANMVRVGSFSQGVDQFLGHD